MLILEEDKWPVTWNGLQVCELCFTTYRYDRKGLDKLLEVVLENDYIYIEN